MDRDIEYPLAFFFLGWVKKLFSEAYESVQLSTFM